MINSRAEDRSAVALKASSSRVSALCSVKGLARVNGVGENRIYSTAATSADYRTASHRLRCDMRSPLSFHAQQSASCSDVSILVFVG